MDPQGISRAVVWYRKQNSETTGLKPFRSPRHAARGAAEKEKIKWSQIKIKVRRQDMQANVDNPRQHRRQESTKTNELWKNPNSTESPRGFTSYPPAVGRRRGVRQENKTMKKRNRRRTEGKKKKKEHGRGRRGQWVQSAAYRAIRSASSLRTSSLAVSFRRPPPVSLVGSVPTLLLGFWRSRSAARCRLASSSSLCHLAMNLSAPCSTPVFHGIPPCTFAASVQTALGIPKVRRSPSLDLRVASNALQSSIRHIRQFCSGFPLCGSCPPAKSPSISFFRRRPSGCLAIPPREEQAPLAYKGFHALATGPFQCLGVGQHPVGTLLSPVPTTRKSNRWCVVVKSR